MNECRSNMTMPAKKKKKKKKVACAVEYNLSLVGGACKRAHPFEKKGICIPLPCSLTDFSNIAFYSLFLFPLHSFSNNLTHNTHTFTMKILSLSLCLVAVSYVAAQSVPQQQCKWHGYLDTLLLSRIIPVVDITLVLLSIASSPLLLLLQPIWMPWEQMITTLGQ